MLNVTFSVYKETESREIKSFAQCCTGSDKAGAKAQVFLI